MRKIQSLVVVVVGLLLCSAAWAAGSAFSNFSADIVTTTHGQTHTSKIYSKDGKSRMEGGGGEMAMITISRPDKKVVWMLMPGTKTYMEMTFNPARAGISSQLGDPAVQTEKKFIANEKVEGHPTKKYHITVIVDGKRDASGFLWEATDMDNFPVKHQTEDGEITTVWKDVKRGGVSDSLFEVPAGYTKMSMPGMGGFGRPQ